MKTIQVTDEMHEFLINLSKELNTQDHRCTAMPYFFQVQTTHRIAVPEGCGTEAWHYDGSLIETEEEIIEEIYEWKDGSISEEEIKQMCDSEKEKILIEAGFNRVNYDWENRLENAFITEKACEEHILRNKHNLREPKSYVSHAFRNPELEKLLLFICQLTGGELHK